MENGGTKITKHFFTKLFFILLILFLHAMDVPAEDFYWERPATITVTDSRFPVTVLGKEKTYLFWEEIDAKNSQIYLSCRAYYSLENYTENRRFAGPFDYSGGEVPDIYTAAVNNRDTIVVAASTGLSSISVYTSTDGGVSFSESKMKSSDSSIMIAPRVYKTSAGNFKMFTSVGEENSFTIYTSESDDGKKWSRFEQFHPAKDYRNPFIPVMVSTDDYDIVVFQIQYTSAETNRLSYQLYMTTRRVDERGRASEWTQAFLITDKKSLPPSSTREFHSYQNQRAFLFNHKGHVYIAWERAYYQNSAIWLAELDLNGIKNGTAEEISSKGSASRPILFEYKDSLYLTWFDTRRGHESIYMAKKNGNYWSETGLVENNNANMFAYPLVTHESDEKSVLSYVWQQKTNGKIVKNSIAILSPDKTCLPPTFTPLSYKKGKSSRAKDVEIKINFPEDSSNIAGYSYTWALQNQDGLTPADSVPPEQIEHFTKENKIKLKASQDGKYVLTARIVDYAGNWSEPASISYHLDLTPPDAPAFDIENVDEYGFLNSNNYNLHWQKSHALDTSSYFYKIDYLGSIPKSIQVSKNNPLKMEKDQVEKIIDDLLSKSEQKQLKPHSFQQKTETQNTFTNRYYNSPNGIYVLYVSAIDEVGNVSEPSKLVYILNKFKPSTYITDVTQKERTGETILTINGGGFTYDGTVSEIYIDRDGIAPYDLVLKKQNENYKVQSDTCISNVNIGESLEQGIYRIILLHTDRGLYTSGRILRIGQNGTVKIESEYVKQSTLTPVFSIYKYKLALNLLLALIILSLCAITLIFMFVAILGSVHEKHITQIQINSLIKGAFMPLSESTKKTKRLPSLKKKLIAFTFSLIIVVVLSVSIQNGYKVVRLQEQTMAAGLENRTDVLLESLHSGVKNFFPANQILELSALPGQKEAMPEVSYVTILGQKQNSTSAEKIDYIWATNDPDSKLNPSKAGYGYGELESDEHVFTEITSKMPQLDKEIAAGVKELSDKIEELDSRAATLYASSRQKDTQEAERISDIAAKLRNQMDEKLSEYSKNASGSYPHFDTKNLDRSNTEYFFYRPVIYRKGTTGNYVHGLIYLKLSTQTLLDSLNAETKRIVYFSIIIAVFAVAFGIFGSFLFASLIVKPIKKLERHVIMIGQTKNKIALKGKDVDIKSKDEVGRLGDAVNNMTHELVANAEEEKLAMDGKAVQKAFLPLSDSDANNKKTTAEYQDNNIQCFGYYEGESGVSGDYFDYKKLDDKWYCIIKCDASGHGIPAAIIMTVVATIFRRYFNNWTYEKKGTSLNKLVEQINDFIEELGLKGKFATLIVCMLNVKTGELYMCNAGDNLVHIYDSATQKMKLVTLSSAPTAGVFTSDLVSLRGGFKVEKTVLNHGDILFLYTDGIEESARRIRESDYSVRKQDVGIKKINPDTHQEDIEHKFEDSKEEFGAERVQKIIEAVYNKRKYTLTKLDNPLVGETLEFDFSKCEGTVSEAILALASLEKVFRLYKSPSTLPTDYIKIDKKIDEFLSRYFNKYDYYAAHKSKDAENSSNYIDYDNMLEDEQSDDLTLLAIKLL